MGSYYRQHIKDNIEKINIIFKVWLGWEVKLADFLSFGFDAWQVFTKRQLTTP